jgi:hypothetical protein
MTGVKPHRAERVALRLASRSRIWLPMQLIVFGATFFTVSALRAEPASHTITIESSRPAYWARVRDDGFVTSVTMQPNALPLDMNSSNSIEGETGDFKPVTYRFGKGILNRRALSPIDRIYTVARIRAVPIVSSGGDWVIAESFEADSHVPRCRYEMLGQTVRTQYVLDKHGRVVRVADIGWRTDVADPRRSGDIRSNPGKHATWIRVFDVNGKGGLNLIGTAWVVDARERGLDDSPPARAELRFSDANGKRVWADQRRFEAALGLDLAARAIAMPQTNPID